MINKLRYEITQGEYDGKKFDIKNPSSQYDIQEKVNEIIDILNAIVIDTKDGKAIDGSKKIDPADPIAPQRKWVGCLVRYKICNWEGGWRTDVLDDIVDHPIYPFKMRNGDTAQVCELVTADEIYPNKARTW